jgi:hypothetical protein
LKRRAAYVLNFSAGNNEAATFSLKPMQLVILLTGISFHKTWPAVLEIDSPATARFPDESEYEGSVSISQIKY